MSTVLLLLLLFCARVCVSSEWRSERASERVPAHAQAIARLNFLSLWNNIMKMKKKKQMTKNQQMTGSMSVSLLVIINETAVQSQCACVSVGISSI